MHADNTKIAAALNGLNGKVTLGIDGYIDEVWQILATRSGLTDYTLYEHMKDFGQLIVQCGEGGVSHEIIRKRRTYGGFTANTGKALIRLGAETTLLGAYGKDSVDPVFQEFQDTTALFSVGDPAVSHILEFTDGKIMLISIRELLEMDWNTLLRAVDVSVLRKLFAEADIIALGYWSNMPAFDEFAANICESCLGENRKQRLFFDLADIRKRDGESLHSTLGRLAALNPRIPMSLSLNEHEAELLFSRYGIVFGTDIERAEISVTIMRNILGLDELTVHTPYFAVAASAAEGSAAVPQQYCRNPVKTTGAGDNFNGGLIAAHLSGLTIAERLTVANAATCFYICNGYSPDRTELICMMHEISKI